MQLMLVNDTEHNFSAVRVEVAINGDVWAYLGEEDAEPRLPARPRAWGTSTLSDMIPYVPSISMPSLAEPSGPYIDNSGSARIVFEDVDLRPSGRVRLDPIHLVCEAALAGTTLTAKWAATSESVSGVARGEFPITISSEIVSPLDQ